MFRRRQSNSTTPATLRSVSPDSTLTVLTLSVQVVLYSYSIGFVYLFFLVAVFTDIASAINYCSYYPKHTYGYAFIFSLTGYLGIQVIIHFLHSPG